MIKGKEAKGRIGARFDDFLREEGLYAHAQAVAIKRVLAWQLAEARGPSPGTARASRPIFERRSCAKVCHVSPET
jgi:hypothetical protein